MAIYGSFLGQGDGYTKAQRTGLRRSAGIKKKRREEERAFEREKLKFGAEEAEKERAGEWAREALKAKTGLEGKGMAPQPESQRGLQELRGEQAREAAEVGAAKSAQAASMAHARSLTRGELGHKRAMELAKVKATDPLSGLFSDAPNAGARRSLGGEAKTSKSILTDFLDMDDSGKKAYMDRLKKEDPDAFLSLAKQYKMWSTPKPEASGRESRMGLGTSSIYRSDSGTYRNF
jgi:hypothetical protein